MKTTPDAGQAVTGATTADPDGRRERGGVWQKFPALVIALACLLAAFVFFPPVRDNPTLVRTFLGVSAALFVWAGTLWVGAKGSAERFRIELVAPLKSHYIQGSVQLCVYAYWGWYWRNVYAEAPLIVAQLVFLYAIDGLLAWSRGRPWRLGFGPLPIILSTNVFIWFKDDWFVFQFLLIATCAFGKEFVKWTRDGKRTHIFNPSAFGLCIFSLVLIATNTTNYTWGLEIAATLTRPPHIYLEIFLLGLIVQYFFSVTLMTVSAVVVLWLLNVVYTGATGTYHFIDTNIPVAVFLGLHLLVTDPSTSPRTNAGKIIFGSLYGLANFVLYFFLEWMQQPEFFDKLLPVPFLNLAVQWMDRVARSGIFARFARFEARFTPRATNLAYIGAWSVMFVLLLGTKWVDAPHEGASLAFWKQAVEADKPLAGRKLMKYAGAQAADGWPPALNEMGVIYMEGHLAPPNRAASAHYFASACELGHLDGCANAATQFLFLREARSDQDVARALDRLERECGTDPDGRSCYLIGFAFETGRGRAMNKERARTLYEHGQKLGNLDACKGLARLTLSGHLGAYDLGEAARNLAAACQSGDAESCMYLGFAHRGGYGVPKDEKLVRELLERACALGSEPACAALKHSGAPQIAVPNLSQAVVHPKWRP